MRRTCPNSYHVQIQLCSALLFMYMLTLILAMSGAERVAKIIIILLWKVCVLVSSCSLHLWQ